MFFIIWEETLILFKRSLVSRSITVNIIMISVSSTNKRICPRFERLLRSPRGNYSFESMWYAMPTLNNVTNMYVYRIISVYSRDKGNFNSTIIKLKHK